MKYEDIIPPNKILFGQFLVDEKKITQEVLKQALQKQDEEKDQIMKESHRLLGQILFEDFKAFKDRLELNRYLNKFHEYKSKMEQIYYELHTIRKNSKK